MQTPVIAQTDHHVGRQFVLRLLGPHVAGDGTLVISAGVTVERH